MSTVRKYGVLLLCLLLLTAAGPARGQALTPDWQDVVPGYWERSALPVTGLATYYAAGLMESVQWRRESSGQLGACPECVGAVALLRAGDIGRKVWLQPPGGEPVGPFLVVDCARRQDVIPLLSRNWAVDISYELGQIWGMTRPLDGVIVLEDPADNNPAAAALDAARLVPTRFYVEPDDLAISAPTPTPTYNPAAPTRWPTRLPGPLPGRPVLAPPTLDPYAPTATSTPTVGPPLPTPLTPIVTTPTPLVTPGLATPEPPVDATTTAVADLEPPSATPLPEVSLGQAGSALLAADAVAGADAESDLPDVPLLSPTPTRTPRPNLTPLLPEVLPTPVPTGPTEEPLLLRLWRELLASFGGE